MATTAVNQNNLVEIIRSNTQVLSDISDIIFKASNTKHIYMSPEFVKTVTLYADTMNSIFGEKGSYTKLIGIFDSLLTRIEQMPKIKLKHVLINKRSIIYSTLIIKNLIQFSNKIIDMIAGNTLSRAMASLDMKTINSIFDNIVSIINKTKDIKITMVDFIRARRINGYLKTLKRLLKSMSDMKDPGIIGTLISMALIKIAIKLLSDTIGIINKIDVKTADRRIKKLSKMMKPLNIFIGQLSEIQMIPLAVQISLLILWGCSVTLGKIFKEFKKMHTLGLKRKIKVITKIIGPLNNMIMKLDTLNIKPSAIIKLMLLERVIKNMVKTLASLILLAPLLALVTLVSPILIIGFWALSKVLSIIGKIALKVINPRAILGITIMGLMITILTFMTVKLLLLMAISLLLIKGIKPLIILFGSLIIIAVMIVTLGLILAVSLPVLIVGFLGITFMGLMITCIFLIAIQLRLLQIINLDQAKIMDNVNLILDTCKLIIQKLFEDEKEPESNGNSTFKKVFKNIFKGLGLVIQAALASAILVLTFVSVTMFLLIATELWILQHIPIDKNAVMTNVNLILGIALDIINTLFDSKDEKQDNTPKSWFGKMIHHVITGIDDILQGILAVAFLALTFVSISMILLISLELMAIQSISLDEMTIRGNVELVLDIALSIIDTLFDSKDEKQDNTPKSWFGNFIKHIFTAIIDIIEAVLAIAFLSLALIAIGMIILLSKELKSIEGLELDAKKIKKNVGDVMDAARCALDAIFSPSSRDGKEGKSFLRKLLKWILPEKFLDIIEAIMAIGYLALILVAVGMIGKLAENLTTIQKLPDMTGISAKVQTVISSSNTVVDAVFGSDGSIKSVDEETINKIERCARMNNSLFDLAIGLLKLSLFTEDEMKRGATTAGYVIGVLRAMNGEVPDPSGVNATEKLLSHYSKFVTTVNKLDIEKLKTTRDMFSEMARFSESVSGNFEGLAGTLNDKIMPLIEELKKLIEEFPETIKEACEDLGTDIKVGVSGQTQSMGSIEEDIKKDHPFWTQEQIRKEAEKVYKEQSENSVDSVGSKLDTLITLLQGEDKGSMIHVRAHMA